MRPISPVAPRKGAWIETRYGSTRCFAATVAPRKGAWIETVTGDCKSARPPRRSPQGSVD